MDNHSVDARQRILIVDDNEAIHEDFRKILSPRAVGGKLCDLEATLFDEPQVPSSHLSDYDLDSAFSGEQAVEMVRAAVDEGRPYALAMVDMRMPPGCDGLDAIEHTWALDPDVQIVICTAYSDHTWRDIVDRLNRRDQWLILRKPFDSAEVCQLALSLTTKWELHRQSHAHMRDLEELVEERTRELRREVEDRRRAEETVREKEARLHAIVDTAPDGIVIFNEAGIVESVNAAAVSVFGLPQEEVCGRCLCKFLHDPPDCGHGVPPLVRLCSGALQLSQTPVETDAKRGDGGTVPVQLTCSEFTTGGRRLYTAIIRDLTEQRQLQCELSQAQKLESVGQLAAGIAHEINSPMQYVGDNTRFTLESLEAIKSVLNGYVEAVDAVEAGRDSAELRTAARRKAEEADVDYLLDEVPRAIEQSLDGIEQVTKIVRAMKEFTHPGSGDDKVYVKLAETLRTTLTVCKNEWKYMADIETDFDPDMPPVPCLPGELNQVFLNLIVNSAHAIRELVETGQAERGVISVSTHRNGKWAEIKIRDTGCGIPDSIRARVFDPFFTTKEVGKGTGQGLAIARSVVVDKHGGTIDFRTTPGEGTEFVVRIPLEEETEVDQGVMTASAV